MRFLKILISVLLCFSTMFTVACADEEILEIDANLLTVHYLDVGQGDSAFIELPAGATMLIDAGESEYGSVVVEYIKDRGHNETTYIVATHPHSDHIGGLEEVVRSFNVKKVYMPKVSSNTKTFEDLLIAVKEKGLTVNSAKQGVVIVDRDNLRIEVLSPVRSEYSDLNNYSVVLMVSYREKKFLFTGDAEALVEKELMTDVSCDVLKIGHHGSDSSSSEEFISACAPEYAVISCGKDNKYGHPHKEILDRLNDFGISYIRTDVNGTLVIESDGTGVTFPNTTIIQKPVVTSGKPSESETTLYILNISSKKIHLPECGSATKMKEENKQEFYGDLEELIAAGYSPCGSCKPE